MRYFILNILLPVLLVVATFLMMIKMTPKHTEESKRKLEAERAWLYQ